MHWRVKKNNYNILIPKLSKHVYELNEIEAAAYFEWYMNKLPERVAYVSEVCAKDLGIPKEKINCTPESLVFLWKWFRRRAKTETIEEVKDGEQTKMPGTRTQVQQLTLETEYMIRDIGMYLGETFRKKSGSIYWTYYTKPRRDFFVNYPLLKGFVDRTFSTPTEVSFEPVHMVRMQALKIIDRTSKNHDLIKLYNLWSSKIVDGSVVPSQENEINPN